MSGRYASRRNSRVNESSWFSVRVQKKMTGTSAAGERLAMCAWCASETVCEGGRESQTKMYARAEETH